MPALRSDAEVRQEVVETLTRDIRVDASQVDVQVENGVVTLRGAVLTPLERSVAGDIVRRVKGVRELRNELQVVNQVNRSDAEIASEVRIDLAHNLDLTHQKIQVEVTGGVVFLRGSVSSLDVKWQADEIAWWTTGVRDVINELTIGVM